MKILGLDIGKRRIGVAISDESGILATAHTTIERRETKEDFIRLKELIAEYHVKEVVVGLPVNLNGKLGDSASEILKFVETIQKKVNIPVKTWDERLTTIQAERILLEADLTRKKRKRLIDKLSAEIILQGYLDHSSRLK